MMMELLRRAFRFPHTTPEEVVVQVETIQEKSEDLEHDLHVIERRTDTLARLVYNMRKDGDGSGHS